MLNYVLKCVQIDAGSVNRSDFFKNIYKDLTVQKLLTCRLYILQKCYIVTLYITCLSPSLLKCWLRP